MKYRFKLKLAALATSLACTAGAQDLSEQDGNLLREACASLKGDAKKGRCFEALGRLSASRPAVVAAQAQPIAAPAPAAATSEEKRAAVRARYAGVLRAYTAIDAAVNSGVKLGQYQQLVLTVVTETAMVENVTTTDVERAAMSQLKRAAEAYRDAQNLWEADQTYFSRQENSLVMNKLLPLERVNLGHLAEKWQLKQYKGDLVGLLMGVKTAESVQRMWGHGRMAFERAATALDLGLPPQAAGG